MKTKEERFIELIDDLYTGDYSVKITLDGSFKKVELFDSKGEWTIDYNQKTGWAWINYARIWSIFKDEYNMEQEDIKQFMQYVLLKYFKINKTRYIIPSLPQNALFY